MGFAVTIPLTHKVYSFSLRRTFALQWMSWGLACKVPLSTSSSSTPFIMERSYHWEIPYFICIWGFPASWYQIRSNTSGVSVVLLMVRDLKRNVSQLRIWQSRPQAWGGHGGIIISAIPNRRWILPASTINFNRSIDYYICFPWWYVLEQYHPGGSFLKQQLPTD